MDDIGEGLQAKRRVMAAVITHLSPPLDRAGFSPELRQIAGIISDSHVSKEKGSVAGEDICGIVNKSNNSALLFWAL